MSRHRDLEHLTKVTDDTGGLKVISRASGAPALDLNSISLRLTVLDEIPEHIVRGQQVLPVRVEHDRVFVATTRPEDTILLDELAFMSGKNIVAYAAHPGQLRDTIKAVYHARKSGQVIWRGPKAQVAGPGTNDSGVETALRVEPVTAPPPMREPFLAESSYTSEPVPVVPRSRPRVLVVDDEPVMRKMLRDALAQRGYEIAEAGTAAEAFGSIKQREPDAILLDAMLPDVHGFEICRRLKNGSRYARIPIIMVTAIYKGWRMAADLKESYGVAAVVEKPFDIHRLGSLLAQALAGRPAEDPSTQQAMSARAQRLYRDAADAYRHDDLDGAVSALSQAVALDPLAAPLHHQLGLVYARGGRDFAAIEELEAAVDLDPTRHQTLRNLAVLYQKHGFRRKASEMWERTLTHAPDEPTRTEVRKILLGLF